MEKKHKIIITILIVIITIIFCAILFTTATPQEKTYQSYNFSTTCSIELPTWINFNEGAGDLNSNSNIMGSNVASTTKALFGNNEIMQITYSHSTVDGANVGTNLNDNMEFDQNGKKVYTRIVMSEETGESISVMGENQEVVNYIADHVKFNGKNATVNATSEETTTSEPTTTTTTNNNNNNNSNNTDDEALYGGFSKEEYYYREGLADGHREAEEALANDEVNLEDDIGVQGEEPMPAGFEMI